MKEKELYIRVDNFIVKFESKCDLSKLYIKNNTDEFKRLTINFEVLDFPETEDTVLEYKDMQNYSVKLEKNRFIFECPWNEIDDSTLLPMIFRYIVEWLRQSKDEIKVHASAICKNGITSLFVAPSEGGKTTTAMAMCQKYKCSLKANDAAVIKFIDNNPYMYRGDTVFKVRFNGLEAYSKEMYNKKVQEKDINNTPWFDKINLAPKDLGILINEEVLPVRYIFFVKLDSLVNGCSVKKHNDNLYECKEFWFKPKMQIFQNIGGTLRGTDLVPIGNDGNILPLNLPSLDTDDLCLKRINFVNSLFNTCKVYQLRGQLEAMTKFINDVISK